MKTFFWGSHFQVVHPEYQLVALSPKGTGWSIAVLRGLVTLYVKGQPLSSAEIELEQHHTYGVSLMLKGHALTLTVFDLEASDQMQAAVDTPVFDELELFPPDSNEPTDLRSIVHLKIGSDDWDPTEANLSAIVALFNGASQDPMGAIVLTNQFVSTEVGSVAGLTEGMALVTFSADRINKPTSHAVAEN